MRLPEAVVRPQLGQMAVGVPREILHLGAADELPARSGIVREVAAEASTASTRGLSLA